MSFPSAPAGDPPAPADTSAAVAAALNGKSRSSAKTSGRRTLLLIDGHSLAYRAFYAVPDTMRTESGQVTNAVYGFTNMLIKLINRAPDALAVCWDTPGPTFRHEMDENYKSTRTTPPGDFLGQLPIIRSVVDVLGYRQFSNPRYEADDLIATMATQASKDDWGVTIVTGDRDAFQLASPQITVCWTRRGVTDTVDATPEWVRERYGLDPAGYLLLAALRGDPSDNLPGVPGVGEKTALKLLTKYQTLDGIFEHLEDMTPKLRENLAASRDRVNLNLEMSRLVRDVPDLPSPDTLRREYNPRMADARELFASLEFHTLLQRLYR